MALKKTVRNYLRKIDFRLPRHLRVVMSVKGGIDISEAELLHELARKVSLPNCIVEIGSYRGRSTIALALGAMAGEMAPVYAIDPHEEFMGVLGGKFGPQDRKVFFANMLKAKVAEIVRLINLPSEMVVPGWNKPVGLLWIDGDHRYEAVKVDFWGWEPFIVPGGLIALHDSLEPDLGPSRVIQEALASGRFRKVNQVKLTTVLEKLLLPES